MTQSATPSMLRATLSGVIKRVEIWALDLLQPHPWHDAFADARSEAVVQSQREPPHSSEVRGKELGEENKQYLLLSQNN